MTAHQDAPRLAVRASGPVGTIAFSNPRKRNALTFEMWRKLPAAIAELDADDSIRVVVIEGEGHRTASRSAVTRERHGLHRWRSSPIQKAGSITRR